MGVYMTILFSILTVEMVTLTVLVLPLPLKLRKASFKIYQKLFNSREFLTVCGISGILVGLLFIDSFRKVIKLKTNNSYDPLQVQSNYIQSAENVARIFYNQRNIYISGAILFLSVAIPTAFQIIKRLVKYQELKINQTDPKVLQEKYEELVKTSESRDKELIALKSQKKGLERSYDELSDKLNEHNVKANKKSD